MGCSFGFGLNSKAEKHQNFECEKIKLLFQRQKINKNCKGLTTSKAIKSNLFLISKIFY
jgi:hypothetical protein